ncbi:MAG: hypothetical protein M3075_09910 [Candidatus Dormibacteraeota bacterium]|nr:hypothetical protein [Candidatus Dormibacteraeota bacterium]
MCGRDIVGHYEASARGADHAPHERRELVRTSDAAVLLAEAGSDVLAVATLPREHWHEI